MKKDILLVINTLGRAGAEQALLALINNLDEKQFNIDVYVLLNQGELASELPEHVTLLNKAYYETSVLSQEGKKKLAYNVLKSSLRHASIFKNAVFLIKNIFRNIKEHKKLMPDKLLWRVISDGAMRFDKKYDLAIAYIEGGSAYYVRDHVNAVKKAGFIHIDYEQAGYTRSLDKDCYYGYDRIFTVSDEVKEHFLKVYTGLEDKTMVFHNFLNERSIKTKAKQEPVWPEETKNVPFKLLTIGRLTYQKGYDVAIQAMKIMKHRGLEVCWVVFGDGPERKRLEEMINQNGLEKDFILAGAVDNPYPYLDKCDVYVHATRFEGKSIAIQEAQILSKPIVASDCSGNREQIISGADGVLCEYTPEGIADAVQKMLNDKELAQRCAKNAGLKKINHIEDLELIYELMNM